MRKTVEIILEDDRRRRYRDWRLTNARYTNSRNFG